jgi:DNA adenine methylase
MFRYNAKGEFNIPYGGMSYNDKNFVAKVNSMFSKETAKAFQGTQIYNLDFADFLTKIVPSEDDFMFLDPPYDTDFSDYLTIYSLPMSA